MKPPESPRRRFIFPLLVSALLMMTTPAMAQPADSAVQKLENLVSSMLDWLGFTDDENEASADDPEEPLPSMGFEIEPNG